MNSGLSWADQWDYDNPDPPPPSSSENDKKKGKDGSKGSKFGKSILKFKWIKDIRKKSQKQ
ncbi:uncharacterized protein LOC121254167 [Juglans microcarpa x Juglans regia]|uniref:Uncharacterized protein LOC108979961 n=1 Tax=Juglans regia TaxID=51240 RepID=A0A2I4DGN3_JUGRE|nr:uncharacterized protein LOC108979961 [Juglans regia]XP_041010057.1 uncharacterized protein LOC121254167 [Juglans microcarpa x Juglans regia]